MQLNIRIETTLLFQYTGKSQVTRKIVDTLRKDFGKLSVVVVRHPMPYGDLSAQAVQRFGCLEDLDKHACTIEEREEYEQHIINGTPVYAGRCPRPAPE